MVGNLRTDLFKGRFDASAARESVRSFKATINDREVVKVIPPAPLGGNEMPAGSIPPADACPCPAPVPSPGMPLMPCLRLACPSDGYLPCSPCLPGSRETGGLNSHMIRPTWPQLRRPFSTECGGIPQTRRDQHFANCLKPCIIENRFHPFGRCDLRHLGGITDRPLPILLIAEEDGCVRFIPLRLVFHDACVWAWPTCLATAQVFAPPFPLQEIRPV